MLSRRSTRSLDLNSHDSEAGSSSAALVVDLVSNREELSQLASRLVHYEHPQGVSMAISPNTGPIASAKVMAAWKAHLDKLSPVETAMFQQYGHGNLAEYVKRIENICQMQGDQSKAGKVAKLFQPIFQTLNMYAPIAQTMIQADPSSSALLLGGITCVMSISKNFLDYQEKIVQTLSEMGEKLEILLQYGSEIYQNNDDVQEAIVEVFGDILQFSRQAWQMFRDEKGQPRSSLHSFGKSLLKTFEMRFGESIAKFDRDLKIFQDRAELCERRATKNFRSLEVQSMKQQFLDGMSMRSHFALLDQRQLAIRKEIGNMNTYEMRRIEAGDREKKEQLGKEQELKMQKILEWLPSIEFWNDQNAKSRKRIQGTGSWILNDAKYTAWKAKSTSDILWVQGKKGCGKSIIASVVIADLEAVCDTAQNFTSVSHNNRALAYIYCTSLESIKIDPSKLLGSILQQLCHQLPKPATDEYLERIYDRHNGSRPISDFELRESINTLLSRFRETFLVVDGLDELHTLEDAQFEEFCQLLSKMTKTGNGEAAVKLAVFSRPDYAPIGNEFSKSCTITLDNGANENDIEAFITLKLSSTGLHVKNDPKLLQEIKTDLLCRAEGMFLWVDLVLNSLKGERTVKGLRRKIKEIPSGLDRQYETSINRILAKDETERKLALDALLWVVNSRRALNRPELFQALAIRPGMIEIESEDMIFDDTDLTSDCEDLIVLDSDGCYRLLHSSLRDYIREESIFKTTIPPEFRTLQQNADSTLGEICLTFLNFELFENGPVKTTKEMRQLLKTNPFLRYAATNWGTTRSMTAWLLQGLKDIDLSDGPLDCRYMPVHCAASYNWSDLIKTMIDLKFDPNSRSEGGEMTPLHLAARNASMEALGVLVDLGLDINARDINGSTPLNLACENNNSNIAERLIEQGADVTIPDYCGLTALHSAALSGDVSLAALLLLKGPDPNAICDGEQKGKSWTALHLAAQENSHGVLALLLKYGADFEKRTSMGSTPLHLSCLNGSLECFVQLLDAGAKIDAQTGDGRNALHLSAERGSLEVLHILHTRSTYLFDQMINQPDRDGETPLFYAVRHGHEQTTRFLLENGALFGQKSKSQICPIHLAILCRQSAIAQLLLKHDRANSCLKGFGAKLPLHYAACFDIDEVILMLLEASADPEALDDQEETAIHAAARHGSTQFAKLLTVSVQVVDFGAKNKFGQTPLHLAASQGSTEFIDFLLQQEHDLRQVEQNDGDLPIHIAAWNGHLDLVKKLLTPENINTAGEGGMTAIFSAAVGGHTSTVEFLLEMDADPNIVNNRGQSPLMVSLNYTNEEVLNLLLDHGANPHVSDKDGYTALHYACSTGAEPLVRRLLQANCDGLTQSKSGTTPFMVAISSKNVKLVDVLLESGVNGWAVPDYKRTTCFHALVCWGELSRIHSWKHYFSTADFKAKDVFNRNAFDLAAEEGHVHMLETLISLGVDHDDFSDCPWGALGAASHKGFINVVKKLIDLNFNVDKRNYLGQFTPFEAAVIGQRPRTAKLLLSAGADCFLRDALGLNALDWAARCPQIWKSSNIFPESYVPTQLVARMPHLQKTAQRIIDLLILLPDQLNARQEFDRWDALSILQSALLEIGTPETVEAAVICTMEIAFLGNWTLAFKQNCEICNRDNFSGGAYLCKESYDYLCAPCYSEYSTGDDIPKSTPKSLRNLEKLEDDMHAVREALEPFIDKGSEFIALSLTLVEQGKEFLEEKEAKYTEWHDSYNHDGRFDNRPKPGLAFLKVLKKVMDAWRDFISDVGVDMEYSTRVLREELTKGAPSEEAKDSIETQAPDEDSFSRITENFLDFVREHHTNTELKHFSCLGHEYVEIPDKESATEAQKQCFGTDGRILNKWLAELLDHLRKSEDPECLKKRLELEAAETQSEDNNCSTMPSNGSKSSERDDQDGIKASADDNNTSRAVIDVSQSTSDEVAERNVDMAQKATQDPIVKLGVHPSSYADEENSFQSAENPGAVMDQTQEAEETKRLRKLFIELLKSFSTYLQCVAGGTELSDETTVGVSLLSHINRIKRKSSTKPGTNQGEREYQSEVVIKGPADIHIIDQEGKAEVEVEVAEDLCKAPTSRKEAKVDDDDSESSDGDSTEIDVILLYEAAWRFAQAMTIGEILDTTFNGIILGALGDDEEEESESALWETTDEESEIAEEKVDKVIATNNDANEEAIESEVIEGRDKNIG